MKVYLDYIFFENLVINYTVLYQVNVFTKSNNKKIYLIISSIIISIYITISKVINFDVLDNIILRIFLINFSLYIAYFPKKISEYIKKEIYYYLIYFMYIGVVIALTLFFNISINNIVIRISIYLLSGIIIYIFNSFLWKMWKTNIKNDSLTYNIIINGQEITCFVDTGNSVYDYVNRLDVIFLDKKWYNIFEKMGILTRKTNIVVRTVTSEDFITGYIVDNVKIVKNKKCICTLDKIIVSFPNQTIGLSNRYSGLIGYNLYIEKMGGVFL